MSFRFAGIFALVIGLSNTTPVFADEASVKCVQEELNGLGYDAGSADGKMGGKSRRNVSTTLRQRIFEFRLGLAPFSLAG